MAQVTLTGRAEQIPRAGLAAGPWGKSSFHWQMRLGKGFPAPEQWEEAGRPGMDNERAGRPMGRDEVFWLVGVF